MIFRGGRALARLPLISSIGLDNRCVSLLAPYLERVASLGNTSGGSHQFKSEPQSAPTRPLLCRTYATKAVSRPKAHTGRTTSAPKKKATTTKATTPKSPSKPKTSATKKTKGSSKPRTKAKSTKARTRKAKAKSKPKKKALTVEQKEARKKKQAADKLKELKAIALVPPKGQPSTAWMVISSETHKDQRTAPGGENSSAKAASAKYRAFTPEQRERYNHIANQNKASNKVHYRHWIQSFSPIEIHRANNARVQLRRKTNGQWSKLHDEREVKRARNIYNLFYGQRYKSGDFTGMKAPEAAKLIGSEWKSMNANERKPYADLAVQEQARYDQEVKAVYNQDTKRTKPKAS